MMATAINAASMPPKAMRIPAPPAPNMRNGLHASRAKGHCVGYQAFRDYRGHHRSARRLVEYLCRPPEESEQVDVPQIDPVQHEGDRKDRGQ
jgi:hypothetical protein